MNIKEFYTFFTYDKIISKLLIPETINLISYSNLKNIFDKVGLFLSNSTMRFSKELAQNSNLASYNYEKAFKRAIKEEIIIIKILKFKNDDKMVSKNERDIELNMKSYKKYFDKEMKEDINLRLIG